MYAVQLKPEEPLKNNFSSKFFKKVYDIDIEHIF